MEKEKLDSGELRRLIKRLGIKIHCESFCCRPPEKPIFCGTVSEGGRNYEIEPTFEKDELIVDRGGNKLEFVCANTMLIIFGDSDWNGKENDCTFPLPRYTFYFKKYKRP